MSHLTTDMHHDQRPVTSLLSVSVSESSLVICYLFLPTDSKACSWAASLSPDKPI